MAASKSLAGENKIHQLSPYVGKLKCSSASALVGRFSELGDLVVDPFSGSGTIPFEAKLQGRATFSADISDYAKVLTLGKLHSPLCSIDAKQRLNKLIKIAEQEDSVDLRKVPIWVRQFFHPKTLKEAIQFADVCIRRNEFFFLSCLLGILHHQRPGFLSYPSSHLTPYLRNKNFPREKFPELYQYRDYRPRLKKKVERALSRGMAVQSIDTTHVFRKSSITGLTWPVEFDAIITSPPYMNALDYGRDNRLRLWFINRKDSSDVDERNISTKSKFEIAIKKIGEKASLGLKKNGYLVIVIGELVNKKRQSNTLETTRKALNQYKEIKFLRSEKNPIPDNRRSRRNCVAVKNEYSLIYVRR